MNCEECLNSVSEVYCEECEQSMCEACNQALHKGGKRKLHNRKRRSPTSVNTLYWDLATCQPKSVSQISFLLSTIESKVGPISQIKTYGKSSKSLEDFGIVHSLSESIPEIQSILLDISQISGTALIISEKALQFKPHMLQLQANISNLSIYISTSIDPISLLKLSESSNSEFLVLYLQQLASSGLLLHDMNWLALAFAESHKVPVDLALETIQSCELLHISFREFGNRQGKTLVGLKLLEMTQESLYWVLQSLKVDEMLPTERAIQSRIKETFDLKLSNVSWMNLLEKCRSSTSFTIKEYVDAISGNETVLVYPGNEEWSSIDQYIRDSDVLGIKGTEDWREFLMFFEKYFTANGPPVAGGRYGCAQFLKMCGSESLQQCSLGKLSYMIQMAINEDLLRYQKCLLIWTSYSKKHKVSAGSSKKIRLVKQAIVDTLKESKGAISLAQLPIFIKKKVHFQLDLQALGFAKLKDLIVSIPEVYIEKKGGNNPFAVLRSKARKGDDFDFHRSMIENFLNEEDKMMNDTGAKAKTKSLGFPFDRWEGPPPGFK